MSRIFLLTPLCCRSLRDHRCRVLVLPGLRSGRCSCVVHHMSSSLAFFCVPTLFPRLQQFPVPSPCTVPSLFIPVSYSIRDVPAQFRLKRSTRPNLFSVHFLPSVHLLVDEPNQANRPVGVVDLYASPRFSSQNPTIFSCLASLTYQEGVGRSIWYSQSEEKEVL